MTCLSSKQIASIDDVPRRAEPCAMTIDGAGARAVRNGDAIIRPAACRPDDETGRRSGLKIRGRKACRFESGSGYQ